MDKQRCIAAAAETEEDRLLLARLYDKLNHGAEREIFSCTAFLSPREQEIGEDALRGVIEPTGYKVTGYTSAPYEKKGLFGHLKK